MRVFISLILLFFSVLSFAQSSGQIVATALQYISQGKFDQGFADMNAAAKSNNLAAQFYVGECYEYGIGTEHNMQQAYNYYRCAAERGLPDAMAKLSVCYSEGKGVAQNETRGQEWHERFNKKGGTLLLPDIDMAFNEGKKHSQNYVMNSKSLKDRELANGRKHPENDSVAQQQSKPVAPPTPFEKQENQYAEKTVKDIIKSDVDQNIPYNEPTNLNTFVVVIANEDYTREMKVEFAKNDGTIFAKYCQRTLGIPPENIHLITNATLNDMRHEIRWLSQVLKTRGGQAKAIVYYAGHGIPDESSKAAYLLPVDGYGTDVGTGYALAQLYADLCSSPAQEVLLFLDACFSGSTREGKMLAESRGVALKVRSEEPLGNMVVFSAAKGDETAYPYMKQSHGLFTYYLLQALKDSKGNVTLKELGDYLTKKVSQMSIVINGKTQTPTISSSKQVVGEWEKWKL